MGWGPMIDEVSSVILDRFAMRRLGFGLSAIGLAVVGILSAPSPVAAAPPEPPPQVAKINMLIEQGWRDYDVRPAPELDDARWCRRVYLDILGRIPSLEELEAFVGDREVGKRQRLVDSLLFDDKYIEQYSRNWAT